MRTASSHRAIGCCIGVFLLMLAGLAQAQNALDLNLRLLQAEEANGLDGAGLTPWYLKLAVQLYQENGKPGEQGTVEEWWAGPSRIKLAYTFPSYKATEVYSMDRIYRSPDASYPPAVVDLLLQQVVHPLRQSGPRVEPVVPIPPTEELADHLPKATSKIVVQPELRLLKYGKVPLDCILMVRPGKLKAPIGRFPTYCFNPGTNSLRLSYNYGGQLVLRNSVGNFQQKEVPLEVVVRSGELTVISGHVTALMAQAMTDADLKTDGLTDVTSQLVNAGAGAIENNLLQKVQPTYPLRALQNHSSGAVLLDVVFGADGHAQKVTAVSSPDPDLTHASEDAIKQWVYRPYLLDGQPTPVHTMITFDFNFGPYQEMIWTDR